MIKTDPASHGGPGSPSGAPLPPRPVSAGAAVGVAAAPSQRVVAALVVVPVLALLAAVADSEVQGRALPRARRHAQGEAVALGP